MKMGDIIKALRLKKGLTQEELGKYIGVQKSAIRKYESGMIENIKRSAIQKMADVFNVSPSYIMGFTNNSNISNIYPIEKYKIPMLGEVACGKPIYCVEDRESYVEVGTKIRADFCLRARGDSMTGARINDGDIVFIQKQSMVDNGDIGVVIIDNEATLKRVFYYPDKQKLVLQSENPKYEPFVFVGDELNDIIILGRAIAFQSDL